MHHNLGITGEQRLQFVMLLSRAADDVGLPDDPEFRAALMGYAEWGTRLAVHNSQPGADVAATRRSRGGAGASLRLTPRPATDRIDVGYPRPAADRWSASAPTPGDRRAGS